MERRHWPVGLDVLAYGGDYSPEQWPKPVWQEDVRLMREAGVTMVSIGIFTWALLEPVQGQYDFGWLDQLLELLQDNEIRVDLATPTVVPPAWFYERFPSALPVSREGVRYAFGGRGTICHSSPAYQQAAVSIAEQLGRRYGRHPALAMWHVHNEYGAPVSACYCEISAAAFRRWLADRYITVKELNEAWGTTFWGQTYNSWQQVEPPRLTPTVGNQAQELDWLRFTNDEMLANFMRERDVLRRESPGIPVTTNFHAALSQCQSVDYWSWASAVDVVTNDHYLVAEDERAHVNLAMTADITRSLAGGRPWLLLEHSTSAVNWQHRNVAKGPGEMARNSLAHVARGSDGAMFFQWRASRFGVEKFHSAMLPHAGVESRIWREVVRLGEDLGKLAPIRGSEVATDISMLWDWQSWWAQRLEWRPSGDLDARERAESWYAAAYDLHLTVDFAHPEAGLRGRPLVVVPALYAMTEVASENLRRYVEDGGVLVVSCFSGIVDEHDTIHNGPHPGALRDVLGLTVEEFAPLRADQRVRLDSGMSGGVWSEFVSLSGAVPVWNYVDGPAAGRPAVTRHPHGRGSAWYVSTCLARDGVEAVLLAAAAEAKIPSRDLPRDVEVVERTGEQGRYLFAINHTRETEMIPVGGGTELLTGASVDDHLTLPAGAVRVVFTPR
ncbi:beta-galactosidase [Lentzea sp. BCCO 10_0798]|uniref:Beta-galactosidase n=1 Tax=Lentzea kristufekii TaxID=3095430 RepID=A0ABU4U7Z0_9PSEU|nr:beta-galactosidase [Lentzea sp. BCCO 10_0798]MDX8056721.1 beta-galactosidase [Lentzea sp. BCCO 10_0798]